MRKHYKGSIQLKNFFILAKSPLKESCLKEVHTVIFKDEFSDMISKANIISREGDISSNRTFKTDCRQLEGSLFLDTYRVLRTVKSFPIYKFIFQEPM